MNLVTPALAVDIVIVNPKEGLLYAIQRRNDPLGLALPGGFVDVGETCEDAARREAMEETNLKLDRLYFIGVYDDPKRDPRKHVVSIAFFGTTYQIPTAGDDAREIVPLKISEVRDSIRGQMYEKVGAGEDGTDICAPMPPPPVFPWCFDHAQIVKEAENRFGCFWNRDIYEERRLER